MTIKKIISIMLILSGFSVQAQHTVGSGGDYIRQIFEKARSAAIRKISDLNKCSLQNAGANSEVKEWILKNQLALQNDIKNSMHLWVADAQSTCAFTQHAPESAVYLSYVTCRKATSSLMPAAFTLIHESAHHLGVSDEKTADQIAQSIISSHKVKTCDQASASPISTSPEPSKSVRPPISPLAPDYNSDGSVHFKGVAEYVTDSYGYCSNVLNDALLTLQLKGVSVLSFEDCAYDFGVQWRAEYVGHLLVDTNMYAVKQYIIKSNSSEACNNNLSKAMSLVDKNSIAITTESCGDYTVDYTPSWQASFVVLTKR